MNNHMKKEKKPRKHTLLMRCFAALACLLVLFASIAALFIGFTTTIIASYVLATVSLVGPVAAGGIASIGEFFGALFELLAEGIALIVEFIMDLFSGFS